MRRFSQRNSLVTLSDINITPLLDLAFVLLIIFVITTPLLEKGLPLKLSQGGITDQKIEKKDIRVLEITAAGEYTLDHRRTSLASAVDELARQSHNNPNLVVHIRADRTGKVDYLMAAIDRCTQKGITRYSLRTEPEGGK